MRYFRKYLPLTQTFRVEFRLFRPVIPAQFAQNFVYLKQKSPPFGGLFHEALPGGFLRRSPFGRISVAAGRISMHYFRKYLPLTQTFRVEFGAFRPVIPD